MASISKDLLRKILVKYAGVPNKDAVLVANELDEMRKYDTAVALLADLANVAAGTMAYAIDTGAVYLRSTAAFALVSGGSAEAAEAYLQTKVAIPATEIKTLAATPKTLVAAVSGKVIILHGYTLELVAGTQVLAAGVGDDLLIKYVDGSGLAASPSIETTGFIDQATNTYLSNAALAIAAGTIAQVVNTPLVLHNIASEITGNIADDAILNVWPRYSLLTAA